MRVFLAVHLPRLSLEVFQPRWLSEPEHGSAVLEKDKVVIADSAARMAGVQLGMKRGGVTTLSPETVMYERDLTRETAAQREVGMALMRFSPDVALLDEATVIVEVGSSLRLFGGLLSLCRQAKAMLAALGLTARISAAPTGHGAWLLAKHAKGPGAQRAIAVAHARGAGNPPVRRLVCRPWLRVNR
jgi:protein ImuB